MLVAPEEERVTAEPVSYRVTKNRGRRPRGYSEEDLTKAVKELKPFFDRKDVSSEGPTWSEKAKELALKYNIPVQTLRDQLLKYSGKWNFGEG